MVRNSNLDAVLNGINKKFGANTVSYMSNIKDKLEIKRYPTPSYEFDIMLGGGLAVGKIVEFYGTESSGKTSMAIEIIKHNQKLAREKGETFTAGWFECEESVDPEFLEQLGVDMEHLVYWDQRNVSAEAGFDILRALVSSGEFDIIVVNSIAGLCAAKELDDDMEKQNIGLTARMLSKLFRVVTGVAAKNNCTLLFINQIRMNVGVTYGNPETTSGGKALGYYSSQRVAMRRVKLDASDHIDETTGLKISCRTVKNRYAKGNPFLKCEYYAKYNEGIDTDMEVINILERNNIINKKGSWYSLTDKDNNILTLGDKPCKWQGRKGLVDDFANNEEVRSYLLNLMDKLMKSENLGTSLSDDEIEKIKSNEARLDKEMNDDI